VHLVGETKLGKSADSDASAPRAEMAKGTEDKNKREPVVTNMGLPDNGTHIFEADASLFA
jgi:hypothetical protein